MNRNDVGITFFALMLSTCILLTGYGVQAAPQSVHNLSRQALAVLQTHCAKCHGQTTTAGFNFHDRKMMLAKELVKPGDPAHSRIYIRAALSPNDPMPPKSQNNALSSQEKALLKEWIAAGAPDFTSLEPEPENIHAHTFKNEEEVLQTITHDLDKANERERPFLRYFTLTNLSNAGASPEDIQAYRIGLSKLLNSLSWQKRIVIPQPIDADQTIVRIDLRSYFWTDKTWKQLLSVYPYYVISALPVARYITQLTRCDLPYVRADWFVSHAALPPLYHDLLGLPKTASELEAKLGVNRDQDFQQETLAREGLQESGVSRNNRVVERHESFYGAYWRTFDFRSSSGSQNIFQHPLDFEPAGGEIIFNLPNGLQAYMLVNGNGDRIDDGPIDIVSNKDNSIDPVVHNGLTCSEDRYLQNARMIQRKR